MQIPPARKWKFTKTRSRLSRTDSLSVKERSLNFVLRFTGIDLVMEIQLSKGMDTEAWRSLLK